MHRIIALWSHPRSMSTAMERIMRERGDLYCYHEPFMYDYYVDRQVRKMPHFNLLPEHPTDYDSIKKMILAQATVRPVFFKDMSYYVMPRITLDNSFLEKLTHCFLIRNPLASITSYFKLDSKLTLEEIGLEAQWQHYRALQESGHMPVVVEAEAIRRDPEAVVGNLWRKIGLDYIEHAFDWQSETPKDWEQVENWHKSVSNARGIQPITSDEEERLQKDFSSLVIKAPFLQAYLDHHLPFYELLRASALTQH